MHLHISHERLNMFFSGCCEPLDSSHNVLRAAAAAAANKPQTYYKRSKVNETTPILADIPPLPGYFKGPDSLQGPATSKGEAILKLRLTMLLEHGMQCTSPIGWDLDSVFFEAPLLLGLGARGPEQSSVGRKPRNSL